MPSTDRNALQRFLAANAKNPDLVAPAMTLLESLFAIADAGTYTLESEEMLDAEEVAAAIAAASGLEVKEVRFVSASRSFATPAGATEQAHRAALWTDLWELIAERFRDGLLDAHRCGAGRLVDEICDVYERSLWNGLRASLCDELALRMAGELKAVFSVFLGFVVIGDVAGIRRLSPLIRLLPRAIPLGERIEGTAGTWLVAAA